MSLIFSKQASEVLERMVAKPVASDTARTVTQATTTAIKDAFGADAFKSSSPGLTKLGMKVVSGADKAGADKAAADIAESFSRNGMRSNLDEAILAFNKEHPKAPTAKAIEAFTHGTGSATVRADVEDFVTPIVTYRPRNPTLVPNASEAAQLRKIMSDNRTHTLSAIRTLTNKDRAAFDAVYRGMETRPDGQLALLRLLWDGKLSMGGAADANRNLIQALGDIAKNDRLDSGILHRRTAFLAELTQELADPVAVSQHYKGTCAATSRGQILWSIKNPTDYTDFVHNLAKPQGKAKLPNGEIVRRPADWDAGNDKAPNPLGLPGKPTGEGRTISSQLTEPVFMQVGYGKQYRYSNTFDAGFSFSQPGKQVMDGGLYGEQEAKLLEAISPGKKYTVLYPNKAELKDSFSSVPKSHWSGARAVMSLDEQFEVMAKTAAIDNPIPTGLDYELGGGHALLVTGVHEVTTPAVGKLPSRTDRWVDYINPWGQRETQREDAFKKVFTGITGDDSVAGVVGT